MTVSTPVILQREGPECGLACVAILLEWHGIEIELEALRKRAGLSQRGCNVQELASVARAFGLELEPTSLRLEQLLTETPPYIVHIRFDHFCVVEGVSDEGLHVNDPMAGPQRWPWQSVNDSFTGVALRPTDAARPTRRWRGPRHQRRRRALLRHFLPDAAAAVAAIAVAAFWTSGVALVLATYVLLHTAMAARRLALWRDARALPSILLHELARCHPRAKMLRMAKTLVDAALSGPQAAERLLRADIPALVCAALSLGFLIAAAGTIPARIALVATAVAATVLQLRLLEPKWARNFRNERRPEIFATALLHDIWRSHGSGFELDSVYKAADSCALMQYRIHAGQRATALAGTGALLAILLFFLLSWALAQGRWQIVGYGLIVCYGLHNLARVRRAILEAIDLVDAGRELDTVRLPVGAAPGLAGLAETVVLTASGLRFSHRREGAPLLDAGPFQLAQGEHVVLSSPPRGGRSTFLKLLAGRLSGHDGMSGTIRYNCRHGPPIMVGDRPVIFDGSLRANLALGHRRDDAELWEALRLVELDGELRGRGGLAMMLTSFAPALSGGQLGRLSLAQALLRRPSALLLDNTLDGVAADQEARILARIKASGLAVVSGGSRAAAMAGFDRSFALAAGGDDARRG